MHFENEIIWLKLLILSCMILSGAGEGIGDDERAGQGFECECPLVDGRCRES